MAEITPFLTLVTIFILTIMYAFSYIEILLIVYKLFYKERHILSAQLMQSLLCIVLLLFVAAYFVQEFTEHTGKFDLFFVSLGLFFTSVALFALGLTVRGIWEEKIHELNIKLLSVYSLWIIQGIYLITVFACFLLGLVTLIEYIQAISAIY
jgi:hypothetical protein